MFILRIFLIGMIAFIPTKDSKTLWVLLPNADDPMGGLHAHHAILTFSQGNVEQSSGRNEWAVIKEKINGRDDPDSAGWLLNGERIILPSGEGLPFTKANTRKNGTSQPGNDVEGWDFSWVPSLHEVTGVTAAVKRTLINKPTKNEVAALLHLKQGFLRTYSLSRSLDAVGIDRGALIPFTFAPAGTESVTGNCTQALAEVEVVEIPVMSPSIQIEAQAFAGGASSSVTLKPRDGELTVDLLLANLTPSDPEQFERRSPPAHFANYYNLLAKKPAAGKQLVPVFCEPSKTLPPRSNEDTGLKTAQILGPTPVAPPALYMRTVYQTADPGRASIARPICTSVMLDPM